MQPAQLMSIIASIKSLPRIEEDRFHSNWRLTLARTEPIWRITAAHIREKSKRGPTNMAGSPSTMGWE